MEFKKEEIRKLRNEICDPVVFCQRVLRISIWNKQKEILESIQDNAEVSVRSCHSSGKTYIAAAAVHWYLVNHEDAVVITTAPTFRQVKEILWRDIRRLAQGRAIYTSEQVLETQINIDEKRFALGLSTDRPDQFQGFHSPHLFVVVDEASGISEDIYGAIDALNPTKILLLGNPLSNIGRFADSFKREGVKKIHISAYDTPNVQQKSLIIPGLITQEFIERIKIYYGEDSDVYRIRVLGEFPKADSDSLIGVDEVSQAMEREVNVLPQWEKRMGLDPARFGDDRTAIIVRQMEKVVRKDIFVSLDTMQVAGQVLRIAKEERVSAQNIFIDSIGVGAGVVDRLKEQGWNVQGVSVSEKAEDEEHYLNLRAELYAGRVKEWIKTANIPRDDDFYELANIKYKFNSKGQLQIESKEDMKKRGLSSPDVADALMLTFARPTRFISMIASPVVKPYYGDVDIQL